MEPFEAAPSRPLVGLHIVLVPAWWPSPEQPTAGIFFEDYARAFAAASAKVGVVFPDLVSLRLLRRGTSVPFRPRLLRESVDNIPVIRVRGIHTALGRPSLHIPRYLRWLRRGLEAYETEHGQPDVLHAMCAIPAGWACTRLAADLGLRVVVTEHIGPFASAMKPPTGEMFVRQALADADEVVAVSEGLRKEMHAAGIERDIHVIGNPVAPEFSPGPPPPVERSADGQPTFRSLFVGRLTREKGIGDLILAIERLTRSPGARIEWHFAGEGPLENDIRGLLPADDERGGAVLHGVCNRRRVASLLSSSHFLVLPSHGENCPLAICEALTSGRPVIGTRRTGCAALIGPDDGLLCDIGDADSLAAAIRELVEQYDRWDWRGISERAAQRFGGSVIAREYAALYLRD